MTLSAFLLRQKRFSSKVSDIIKRELSADTSSAIEQYKQTIDLILDETNIKGMVIELPLNTEKGKLSLYYEGETREFGYLLDGKEIEETPTEDILLVLLKDIIFKGGA